MAVGQVAKSSNRVGGKQRCRSAQVVIRSDESIVDKSVDFLIDSGVYSTVMSETDWKKAGKFKLGECKKKFTAYNSSSDLKMLGAGKVTMCSQSGAEWKTKVYVTVSSNTSLLGLKDSEALGVSVIKLEGKEAQKEKMARVEQMRKPEQVDKGIVSGDWTKAEIDEYIKKLTEKKF